MAYALATSYAGEALLSGFNWFDGGDLSHGTVSYQSREDARAKGLYSLNEHTGVVRLGVDHTHVLSPGHGRPSIRLESKEPYNHGLFIADFLHMPPSQCGLWPAFWTYGPNWPHGGEVDIIEGANDQYRNLFSAHTASGCTVSGTLSHKSRGSRRSRNCNVGADNVGCGYDAPRTDASSYGDAFNAAKGGVYAMEWDSDYIKIWHFARSQIPSDIMRQQPRPDQWRLPDAIFGGSSCDVDRYFKDMSLVININFCGDLGNAIWGKTDGCGKYASTCSEFVAKNPRAFANAYWDVRYIDAYQKLETIPVQWNKKFGDGVNSSFVDMPSLASDVKEPPQIDGASFLGCYGSGDGFKSFRQVADRNDMTVERCVQLCNGAKFAGTHDTQCFCADALDPNTRAVDEESGVCDHPCPGNSAEYCGGLARKAEELANTTAATLHDSPAKPPDVTTVAESRPYQNSSSSPAAAAAPFVFRRPFLPTSTGRNNSHGNDTVFSKSTHKGHLRWTRRALGQRDARAKNMLISVYGAVKNDTYALSPPPKAPGQNVTYPPPSTHAAPQGQAAEPVVPVGTSASLPVDGGETDEQSEDATEVVLEKCDCETDPADAGPPPHKAAPGQDPPAPADSPAPGQGTPAPVKPPAPNGAPAAAPAVPGMNATPVPVPMPMAGAGRTRGDARMSICLGLVVLLMGLLA